MPLSEPSDRRRRLWGTALVSFLLVIAAVVVLRGAGQRSSSSSTQPKITWSESQVEAILSPGESATRDLTFTSSLAVENIALEAVPEIAGFLSLQPNSFASVPGAQPQPIEIAFAIPPEAPFGTYEGTIHVRLRSQTLPKTLKLVVRVWQLATERASQVSVLVPPGLTSIQVEDGLFFGEPSDGPVVPNPVFTMAVIDTWPELSTLPFLEVLESIAQRKLGEDLLRVAGAHDGGIEVEARTFERRHFFLYSPYAHKALEFTGREGFLSSPEFSTIVTTVRF